MARDVVLPNNKLPYRLLPVTLMKKSLHSSPCAGHMLSYSTVRIIDATPITKQDTACLSWPLCVGVHTPV